MVIEVNRYGNVVVSTITYYPSLALVRPWVTGACEGVCACSTCHVILENSVYDSLEAASEEEEDMLDQAFGLTPT